MGYSKHGFVSQEERLQLDAEQRKALKEARAEAERKQADEAEMITRIVQQAAYEVDALAEQFDPIIRDIMADFVEANSSQPAVIHKREYCPNTVIDESKPWERYQKVHEWCAEYEAARIQAEIVSMMTDKPLPLIGSHSGVNLHCMIKWGKSVPKINLFRLDDVFEARLGVPAIMDVSYETVDPTHPHAWHAI